MASEPQSLRYETALYEDKLTVPGMTACQGNGAMAKGRIETGNEKDDRSAVAVLGYASL